SSTTGTFQWPISAKVSRRFQSCTRSRPTRDWVMVCSSTLRTSPRTHSTKRVRPRGVKAPKKGRSKPCQSDQSRVACIGHLPHSGEQLVLLPAVSLCAARCLVQVQNLRVEQAREGISA